MVENLVADDAGHLEGLLVADRVDDHVAVDADEVLRVQDAVLILKVREKLVSRLSSFGCCFSHVALFRVVVERKVPPRGLYRLPTPRRER